MLRSRAGLDQHVCSILSRGEIQEKGDLFAASKLGSFLTEQLVGTFHSDPSAGRICERLESLSGGGGAPDGFGAQLPFWRVDPYPGRSHFLVQFELGAAGAYFADSDWDWYFRECSPSRLN